MSLFYLWMIPLTSLLTGCCIGLILFYWIYCKIKKTNSFFLLKESSLVFDNENEVVLDDPIKILMNQGLDSLVSKFKTEIPVASMFLGKAKEEKLKDLARVELFKIIPELKQVIISQISSSKPIDNQRKNQKNFTKDFLYEHGYSFIYQFMGIGALIGLLVGLIIYAFLLLNNT